MLNMKACLLILIVTGVVMSQEIPQVQLTKSDRVPLLDHIGTSRCRGVTGKPATDPFAFGISLHQERGNLMVDLRTKADDLVWRNDGSDASPKWVSRYNVYLAVFSEDSRVTGYYEATPEEVSTTLAVGATSPVVFRRSISLSPGRYVFGLSVRDLMAGDCYRWVTRFSIKP
jgi:hypothetical protein